MSPARRAAAAVGCFAFATTLVVAPVLPEAGAQQTAAAAPVATAVQPGPTQVINDRASAAVAIVSDENGRVHRIRRGGYVLGDAGGEFFLRFYVPRGTTATIVATDPYGNPVDGVVLQKAAARGWYDTNATVDDADLVMITLTSRTRRA